ncbi:MAG: RNA 2',3'-cyclic phosphodiesterase [Lysobacterales bacterium]|jgi:2'-5' RNA ligase
MSGKHRVFFAFVPPAPVREQVRSVQQSIGGGGRPVRPDNFHVTLAFIGSQPSTAIPVILDVASRLAFEQCEVVLDTVGAFRRAGVVWLGTDAVPARLAAFQSALAQSLEQAEIPIDRKPWHFHLTLYRRLRKPPPIMHPIAIEWRLQRFSLLESVSVEKGVEYHPLGHWEARD